MSMRDVLSDEAILKLKRAVWESHGYRTYEPEVDRFHASFARTKIVSSPARTAKSYSAAFDVLPDIIIHGFVHQMAASGQLGDYVSSTQLGWIVCPNFSLAKEIDYLWTELVERADKTKWGYEIRRAKKNASQGDMQIVLFWGKNSRGEDVEDIIEVRTSANEKSLQSEELDWVILSEAAELEKKIWTTYLSTRSTRAIMPTTPKVNAGWILDMIEKSVEHPELNINSFNFTVRANPNYKCSRFWEAHQDAEFQVLNEIKTVPVDVDLPPGEKNGHDCFDPIVQCDAAKEDGFAEQFLGRWTLVQGRVVPLREKVGELGQPAHVISTDYSWFRHADLHVSFDYGFSDGTCIGFWLVGPSQVVLRKSIYETGMVPDDIVLRVMDQVRWFERHYDSQGMLKRLIGDPKKPEVAELFRRRGLPIWDIDKGAQVDRQAGHLEFMNMLHTDPATGEPRMLVHSDNQDVIREWRKLRRSEKVRSETAPTAFVGDDHAYDMTRYFVMSRPIKRIDQRDKTSVTPFELARRRIVRDRDRKQRATVQSAYGTNRVGGLM